MEQRQYAEVLSLAEGFCTSVNETVRVSELGQELLEIKAKLQFDGSLEPFDISGMTKSGQHRKLFLRQSLWKCKSKRQLTCLILSDMLMLLEEKHSKYHFYRQV